MTEQEYREHPGVNKSTLWELRRSPMHYRTALTQARQDTPALRFGRLVHKAVLEPDRLMEMYAAAPDTDRRTKAGRESWAEFIQNVGDREIVSGADWETAMAMSDAVNASRVARDLFTGCEMEKPIFWRDELTGVDCKGRLDGVKHGVVVDYKTCGDAGTDVFAREAMRYGYDLQAAMYLTGAEMNGYGRCDWYFIAQEKTPPYAVNVIKAGDSFIERGIWQMQKLLTLCAECTLDDEWPGYNPGEHINEIILPDWAVIPEE